MFVFISKKCVLFTYCPFVNSNSAMTRGSEKFNVGKKGSGASSPEFKFLPNYYVMSGKLISLRLHFITCEVG
jgi:hypothetical protein